MTSLPLLALLLMSQIVVLTDGTTLEVSKYEVKGELVILTTLDGKLQSLPRGYLDLEATRATAAASSFPVVSPPDMQTLASEAADLVGLRRLTSEISRSASDVADEYHESAGRDALSILMASAIAEGFAEQRFYGVAERAFRERAVSAELAGAIRWLRSPFGRKLEHIMREHGSDGFQEYAHVVEAEPPSPNRLELLHRLDEASGTSEAAIEMQTAMMVAMLQGVNPGLPPEQRLTAVAIERLVQEARPRFVQRTTNRVRLSLMFTYRHVTDEELRSYLGYLESDNGQWLSGVVLKSLYVAMEDAARRSGEVIAKGLAELRKTKA